MDSEKVQKILAMNGGDGAFSYDNNARLTGIIVNRLSLPFIEDLIQKSRIFPEGTIRIADLGCSSARNSFDAIQTIVACLKRFDERNNITLPELQVFLNDLPSNDFNYVFRILPPFLTQLKEGIDLPRCFPAGVPGSFYGRLFPKDSLHFAYSAIALHWLSQVPKAVNNRNSEAWNKGHIFISMQSRQAVAEAYLAQFYDDFSAFLNARGEEMVEGGRMFVVFPGRVSSDVREQAIWVKICAEVLNAAFRALVTEGVIEEETLDSFNLPTFSPSIDEMKTVVEKEGSFMAERIELVDFEAYYPDSFESRISGAYIRSAYEKLVEASIGAKLTESLFEKVEQIGPEMQKEIQKEFRSPSVMLAVILVKVADPLQRDENICCPLMEEGLS